MSIIGIDFGSNAIVIGTALGMSGGTGRGGIDVILNGNSQRRTPYEPTPHCSPSFYSPFSIGISFLSSTKRDSWENKPSHTYVTDSLLLHDLIADCLFFP